MKPLETRSNEGSEAYDTQSHEEASDVGEITHGERFERFERDDVGMGDTAYRHRPLREFRERYPDEYIEPWGDVGSSGGIPKPREVRARHQPRVQRFAATPGQLLRLWTRRRKDMAGRP